MITDDKVIEIFFIIDEFCKEFEQEMSKQPVLGSDGVRRRNRKANMSHSEIMTILLLYHFGTFRNFKHFYMHFIKVHLAQEFPTAATASRASGPSSRRRRSWCGSTARALGWSMMRSSTCLSTRLAWVSTTVRCSARAAAASCGSTSPFPAACSAKPCNNSRRPSAKRVLCSLRSRVLGVRC